jgi:hypothetical protein
MFVLLWNNRKKRFGCPNFSQPQPTRTTYLKTDFQVEKRYIFAAGIQISIYGFLK